MSRDGGQALVVVVALLGLAVLVVISLTDADERILAGLRAQRAAEAGAEAAGAVVADRLFSLSRGYGDDDRPLRSDLVERALAQPDLRPLSAAAATEVLSRLDARLEQIALERRVDEASVRVTVTRAGVRATARVGVPSP